MSRPAGRAESLLRAQVGRARVWCTGTDEGNLGDHVGDDPEVVERNRAALRSRVGIPDAADWVWLRQVHGATVHVATRSGERRVADAPVADAAVTGLAHVALAVVTADCAPVVVANDDAVGVIHAGHRGLAGGVIEAAIAEVRRLGAGPVHAFLGPCIRASSYEFGADDLAGFAQRFGRGVESRTSAGRPALDIPAAIAVVLERERVADFQDCLVDTAASDSYFSFRRRSDSGRQATVAVLA